MIKDKSQGSVVTPPSMLESLTITVETAMKEFSKKPNYCRGTARARCRWKSRDPVRLEISDLTSTVRHAMKRLYRFSIARVVEIIQRLVEQRTIRLTVSNTICAGTLSC